MSEQYKSCNCIACKKTRINLANNPKKTTPFKQLLKTAEKAFKKLFEKGSYNPKDLFKHSEYQALAKGTVELFTTAIPHETPAEMRTYLEQDVFIFSQLKTHTQLTEARQYLKDNNGNIRPYYDFEQKVLKLNKQYNKNYLEAEYEFAVHSSQSAANWANLQDNTDRYWLEYRTAGDERVRQEHEALRGICLPKNDAFWSEFYPPNGWRCRCIAVEVRSTDGQLSNSTEAVERGKKATTKIGKNGKNKLEMFRFNPGQHKKIFPPNNSYSKVVGAGAIIEKAKKEALKQTKRLQKEKRKVKDKEIKQWAFDNINEKGNLLVKKNFITQKVVLQRGKIRSIGNHFTENRLKDFAKDIYQVIDKAQYITDAPLSPESHNYEKKKRQGVEKFTYYKLFHKGENLRLNCEVIDGKEYPYAINIIIKEKP